MPISLEAAKQIALLAAESITVALLLLVFFRLRSRMGLALLYVTLGAFQFLQTLLVLSIYVELAPGLLISPGSAVMFTASLFAVLLVYIREDAGEARTLIYGLIAANVTVTALCVLVGLHLDSPIAYNYLNLPPSLFLQGLKSFLIGTLALVLDVLMVVIIYEFVGQRLTQILFLRIFVAMASVLVFDTLVFVTGSFFGAPNFQMLIYSGLTGKLVAGLFYAAVLTAYLKFFERGEFSLAHTGGDVRRLFNVLTHRERYKLLRAELLRDSMTGIYNRGFFDDNLPRELERANRFDHPTSLLMVDIDNFKSVNDTFGHQAGDRVIRLLAESLQVSLRASDLPCRYGGEEFAVILPDTNGDRAKEVAMRIRGNFRMRYVDAEFDRPETVTMTIGVACFPHEADSAESLVALADKRLYIGKEGGRDLVVAGEALPA